MQIFLGGSTIQQIVPESLLLLPFFEYKGLEQMTYCCLYMNKGNASLSRVYLEYFLECHLPQRWVLYVKMM